MKADFEHINWEMLSKTLTGETTDSEKEEFEKWLSMDVRNKTLFEKLEEVGHDADILQSIHKLDVEQALSKVKKAKGVSRSISIRTFLKVAASLIFVVGISALFWYVTVKPDMITVTTQSGEREEVILADGTMVSINENSTFIYPERFEGKKRNVELTGEAFFSVAPDKEKPFIVGLEGTYVKVLGTKFNILNQPGAEGITVMVSEGMVQFGRNKSEGDALLLKKGNSGKYNKANQSLSFENTYNFNSIAWKTKRLVFKNETLENVIKTLEEVYFIKVKAEENFKERKISATYDNQPVDVIIDILESTLNVKINKTSPKSYEIVSEKD